MGDEIGGDLEIGLKAVREAAEELALQNRLVDVALIIDLSQSMRPCIRNLAEHLDTFVSGLRHYEVKVATGRVVLDAQIAIVGHRATHGKIIELFVQPFTQDLARTCRSLGQLADLAGRRSEATLHAVDWAIDHLDWREGEHRRTLAVFTDERVSTGDLTGVTAETVPHFLEKLFGFTLFLAAPVTRSDRAPVTYAELAKMSFCKGHYEVRGARDAEWAKVDYGALLDGLAKSASLASSMIGGRLLPDVFHAQAMTIITAL